MVLVVEFEYRKPRILWELLHDRFNVSPRLCFVPWTRYSEMEDWYPEPVTDGILILFPSAVGPDYFPSIGKEQS